MSLQQSLTDLHAAYNTSAPDVKQRLAKLKLELAQSGLYFAPPTANTQDLLAARSILEIGAFQSLREGDLKSYARYNFALQPFYDNLRQVIPESPNRPVTLGLHLLGLLSENLLTEFHTVLETLQPEQLNDSFVRLPVDLERWLMEGAYNKVYRAKDRVPRPEFEFLLERLMGTVRGQIASTIESSYPSLPLQHAATLLFYKPTETSSLTDFAANRGWSLSPETQTFTFPRSTKPDIALVAAESSSGVSSSTIDKLRGSGVVRGVPMETMVGPALKLAQQLEAIV
ncbi:hypothetical protein L202_00628 [Cryptococcus amylolentus CBS 6039]|uniref:CSN8/PSMD8/EIF3K domain-containing protein n=2 Tax=Cryptococcus amylolentus TaxID=104669 RepID=A0A1E3I803_9TREE|nr:hypothetical protein L202_00628 [Cryptococcus amylolentus CBS 6039]ODN84750.1 hypothetical protein L202_00628 [Cryptococcus amylolentus CBS 6039]ODO11517.1 hypothetical protein I350_00297 [Cryptococcus amylolentus CBS 6273]